jgi:hypothetical protein
LVESARGERRRLREEGEKVGGGLSGGGREKVDDRCQSRGVLERVLVVHGRSWGTQEQAQGNRRRRRSESGLRLARKDVREMVDLDSSEEGTGRPCRRPNDDEEKSATTKQEEDGSEGVKGRKVREGSARIVRFDRQGARRSIRVG